MRIKGVFFCLVSFFLFSFLVGCKTAQSNIKIHTYTVEEPRVDQDLNEGNRGYLVGRPQEIEDDRNRKLTRTKYVAEIDLGPYGQNSKESVACEQKEVDLEISEEPGDSYVIEEMVVEDSSTSQKAVSKSGKTVRYIVEKNDTLQKISKKFYGTTKKWKKIYDANSDKLKNPDRIYKGQVIEIPQD